jgi:hypothetical protein
MASHVPPPCSCSAAPLGRQPLQPAITTERDEVEMAESADAFEALGHMYANPVKRRLVQDSKDWPWSSYPSYQGRGEILVQIDPVD